MIDNENVKKEADLLDLDKPYYNFSALDSIRKDEEGFFIISVDGGKELPRRFAQSQLGIKGEIISMASRLRDAGYPIRAIEFTQKNGKMQLEYDLNIQQLIKYYNQFKKNVETLKEKYGDDYESHKDEIRFENVSQKSENKEDIYERMKDTFNKYIETLTPEEARKFQTSLKIYNSKFFIAINNMMTIGDYDKKSGAELWENLSENKDFREVIHPVYENCKDILSLASESKKTEDEMIVKEFSEILDFSTPANFMESMKSVVQILDKHKDNICLPEDIEVFRGVATDNADFKKISQSEIISTSLDSSVAGKFTNRSDKKYIYMSCITAKKGTPFMICPTSQGDEQKEIVFFNSKVNTKFFGTVGKNESNIYSLGVPLPCAVYELESEREKNKDKNVEDDAR